MEDIYMMYEEFIDFLGSNEVTPEEYHDIIEPVYTWHPMFEDGGIEAKKNCAMLYKIGGKAVFKELRPVADEAYDLDSVIIEAARALHRAQEDYDRLVDKRKLLVSKYERNKSK